MYTFHATAITAYLENAEGIAAHESPPGPQTLRPHGSLADRHLNQRLLDYRLDQISR
jgi:hypothetical protein